MGIGKFAGQRTIVAISIAVSLGASTAHAETSGRLTLRTITPCRVVDTRISTQRFADGETRSFAVYGTDLSGQGGSPTGCGLPENETKALAINFVAVTPAGAGNLKAWSMDDPAEPGTSILNYQMLNPNLNVANQVTLAVRNTGGADAFNVKTSRAIDLVADVVGYFTDQPEDFVDSRTNSGQTVGLVPDALFFFPMSFELTAKIDGWTHPDSETFVAPRAGLYLVRYGACVTAGTARFRMVIDDVPVRFSGIRTAAPFERSLIVQVAAGSIVKFQFSAEPNLTATLSSPDNDQASKWVVITPLP